jgi:hypothetical protein
MGSAPPDFEDLLQVSVGKDTHNVPGCVLAAVDSSGRFNNSNGYAHSSKLTTY